MDDYLALSLLIMGIAIGSLLLIWGIMSLCFLLRNRKKRRAALEREKARKAELEASGNSEEE